MRKAIFIDYNSILDSSNKELLEKLKRPPKSVNNFYPKLIVITDDEKNYSNNILDYCYLMYNEGKKICVLNHDCIKIISFLLKVLEQLGSDILVWIAIPITEKHFNSQIATLIQENFHHPYITNLSPLNVTIDPSVAFTFISKMVVENEAFVFNDVLHCLQHYKNKEFACSLRVKFTTKAINFLKNAPLAGGIENGNQKEMTGELYVKDVQKEGGSFVYIVDIDEKSVEVGQNEDVDVSPTRYNFHSHPKQAYIRHGVNKAWPSLSDYLGYLELGSNTIFHCVTTIEGLYILSFSPEWAHKLNKVDRSFINDNFDIDHKEKYTPLEYAKKVSGIKYKGKPIYNVQFLSWKESKKPFKVSYAKIGLSCISTQKGKKIMDRLY